MASMYTDLYLNTTANPRRRYTLSTFLAYELRGKASTYSDRYQRVLERDLERLVAAGDVLAVRSLKGGTAYVRRDDWQQQEED